MFNFVFFNLKRNKKTKNNKVCLFTYTDFINFVPI